MAQNHRLLDDVLADATVGVVMQVRAAHAHGVRRNGELSGSWGRRVRHLAHINNALLFENDSLHDGLLC